MGSDEQPIELFTDKRDKIIVRTSVVGIVTNVLLAAFKAAVGLASHSIAVVLDAVNNLSTMIVAGIVLYKEMRFDVVMSFDIRPKEGVEILRKEIEQAYPDYAVLIIPDVDVSD